MTPTHIYSRSRYQATSACVSLQCFIEHTADAEKKMLLRPACLLLLLASGAKAAERVRRWRTSLNVPGWNDVESVFRRFDRDGSGDMNVKELRTALRLLQVRVNTKEAAAVLRRFDEDENGALSMGEFRRLLAKLKEVEGSDELRIFPQLPVWHIRQDRGAINNEVRTLIGEDRLEEAESALRKSVKACCESYGENHPHTLNAKSGLAVILWKRGRREESERLQRATLRRMEETLGTMHADTRIVRDNLAIALRQRGFTNEAESLLQENQQQSRGGSMLAALIMVGISIM